MGPAWFNWIILALSVSMVLVPVHRWYAAALAYRSVPVALGIQMLKYSWAGYNKKYLGASLRIGALFVLLAIVLGSRLPPTLTILISSLVLGPIISLSIPPAVLLLGSSSTGTARLMEEIDEAIYPLRVVALIDPQGAHWTVRQNIAFDNLRTKRQDLWRSVVHPLMDSSLLVVVDARVASPAVVEECIRVAKSPNRVGRSLFVQGENQERPAIDAISFDYPQPAGVSEVLGSLVFVSVSGVPSLVRRMFEERREAHAA
jgi:hypothetical protein